MGRPLNFPAGRDMSMIPLHTDGDMRPAMLAGEPGYAGRKNGTHSQQHQHRAAKPAKRKSFHASSYRFPSAAFIGLQYTQPDSELP